MGAGKQLTPKRSAANATLRTLSFKELLWRDDMSGDGAGRDHQWRREIDRAKPLGAGVTTIGIPIGMAVIVFSVIVTGLYVRRANGEFDALTRDILQKVDPQAPLGLVL